MSANHTPLLTEAEVKELCALVDDCNRWLRLGCWGDLKVTSLKLAQKASKVFERQWKQRSNQIGR